MELNELSGGNPICAVGLCLDSRCGCCDPSEEKRQYRRHQLSGPASNKKCENAKVDTKTTIRVRPSKPHQQPSCRRARDCSSGKSSSSPDSLQYYIDYQRIHYLDGNRHQESGISGRQQHQKLKHVSSATDNNCNLCLSEDNQQTRENYPHQSAGLLLANRKSPIKFGSHSNHHHHRHHHQDKLAATIALKQQNSCEKSLLPSNANTSAAALLLRNPLLSDHSKLAGDRGESYFSADANNENFFKQPVGNKPTTTTTSTSRLLLNHHRRDGENSAPAITGKAPIISPSNNNQNNPSSHDDSARLANQKFRKLPRQDQRNHSGDNGLATATDPFGNINQDADDDLLSTGDIVISYESSAIRQSSATCDDITAPVEAGINRKRAPSATLLPIKKQQAPSGNFSSDLKFIEEQQQTASNQGCDKKLPDKHQLKELKTSNLPTTTDTNQQQQDWENHLDWNQLARKYGKMPRQHQRVNLYCRMQRSCLYQTFMAAFLGLFPITTSFKSYSLPGDFFTDLLAGITIAILHIPQGMAYGLLAGVEPIHGLYVSFIPVLIMALMSKSRHVSYGTFAIISMLLASATDSIKLTLHQKMIQSMAAAAASAAAATSTTTSPAGELQDANELILNRSPISDQSEGFVLANNHRPMDTAQQLLRQAIPSTHSLPMEGSRHISTQAEPEIRVESVLTSAPSSSATDSLPIETHSLFASASFMSLSSDFTMPTNIEILTCFCIVVGVMQIAMACMRLGILSLMFSDQLVSSFTTASAVHVVTSQLGPLFDLHLGPIPDGLFKVFRTWWTFGSKLIDGFNQYTAMLSLISVLFLLSIKEIVEPILRKKFKNLTCLPSELVLMALVILNSWYWQFNENYDIRIIGNVPTGLPDLKMPRLELAPFVFQDAVTIALVSFAMNLSLGQVYAKRYKYKLNANQELFALGASNLISSLFSCFPCASSLSRSAVQSNLNARSQLCSLISCAIVVSIICYFAPILHDLPRSTLSCIIIVALKGILIQVTDLYENWRLSKLDAFVWMLTFTSVLAFGVTYGLVLGIIASLFMIFIRLLTPNHSILGQLPGTEIYIDKNAFLDCEELEQIKIFRFNSALCYLNRTMFKASVEKSLPSIFEKQNKFGNLNGLFCTSKENSTFYQMNIENSMNSETYEESKAKIKYLIIDCSALAYCDYSGAATLVEIIEELEEHKVTVYLAACPLKLIGMIEKMQKTIVLEHNIYPSITDAVNHAKFLKSCTSTATQALAASFNDYGIVEQGSCLRPVLHCN